MAKRNNGSARVSSSSEDENQSEFLKVYMPEICSKRMRVPPRFVKNIGGEIPEIASIRDVEGDSWSVSLEKIDGKVFVEQGWEEFVRDQCLEHGDVLHFRFNGDSEFFVEVFGVDGCRREELVVNRHDHEVRKLDNVEIVLALPAQGMKN